MRRIALIAAALAALSGCGGEATVTKKQEKAPVTVADWRTDAHVACLRAQTALTTSAYASDLRKLRRRLPKVAREVRAGVEEVRALERPPDTAGQRFVAALAAVETALADLVEASRRTMNPGPLTAATRRLEAKVSALGKAAHRSGLECFSKEAKIPELGAIRAPIAAERLAAIQRRVGARIKAANAMPPPAGLEHVIDALDDEDAALHALALPDWARPQRAAFLRASRAYRNGLQELVDRHNGQVTSHEQWLELVDRPANKCEATMGRLLSGLRADPVHGIN